MLRPEKNSYNEEMPMQFGINNRFIEDVDFSRKDVKEFATLKLYSGPSFYE
jgi:hypothetical protein